MGHPQLGALKTYACGRTLVAGLPSAALSGNLNVRSTDDACVCASGAAIDDIAVVPASPAGTFGPRPDCQAPDQVIAEAGAVKGANFFCSHAGRYLVALKDGRDGGHILGCYGGGGRSKRQKVLIKLEGSSGSEQNMPMASPGVAVPETAITNKPHWNPAGSD
jgi:hypothetical protein